MDYRTLNFGVPQLPRDLPILSAQFAFIPSTTYDFLVNFFRCFPIISALELLDVLGWASW